MFNILDIILLILFFIFVFSAYARGLVLTVIDLFSGFLSYGLAVFLSPKVSSSFYDHVLRTSVLNSLQSKYGSLNANVNGVSQNLADVISGLPSNLTKYIKSTGLLNPDKISSAVMSKVTTVKDLEANVVAPVVKEVLNVVFIVVLMILFGIIFRIISHFIRKTMKRTKHLKTVDHVFGGILGFVKSAVYILIISAVLSALAVYISPLRNIVSGSYICGLGSQLVQAVSK